MKRKLPSVKEDFVLKENQLRGVNTKEPSAENFEQIILVNTLPSKPVVQLEPSELDLDMMNEDVLKSI